MLSLLWGLTPPPAMLVFIDCLHCWAGGFWLLRDTSYITASVNHPGMLQVRKIQTLKSPLKAPIPGLRSHCSLWYLLSLIPQVFSKGILLTCSGTSCPGAAHPWGPTRDPTWHCKQCGKVTCGGGKSRWVLHWALCPLLWWLPFTHELNPHPYLNSWSFWAISGDFPGSPVVKILCFQCRAVGSILHQRAKLPHASWPINQNTK